LYSFDIDTQEQTVLGGQYTSGSLTYLISHYAVIETNNVTVIYDFTSNTSFSHPHESGISQLQMILNSFIIEELDASIFVTKTNSWISPIADGASFLYLGFSNGFIISPQNNISALFILCNENVDCDDQSIFTLDLCSSSICSYKIQSCPPSQPLV
jgi:hypothetical protein